MLSVLKYRLELGINTILIPGGLSGKCHVAPQPGVQGLCQLWALADLDKPEQPVKVYVAATGEQINEPDNHSIEYLGTVLLSGGAMVFHALLIKEPTDG